MSLKLISNTGNEYTFKESERLGQGAFGDVFKGFDEKNLRKVAIKRVSNTVLDRYGEEFIRCLGHEANILQQMGNGQYTVTIIDCFQTTSYVNIIMEYCDGGNLADLKKSKGGRFEEPVAINYLAEIVEGLYALHKSGRMHRDLKLENIFIKDGHCKIGDFGFATQQSQAEQYVGTPEYMAPEIFSCGEGNFYDKQVDIWALGIMFHEMLFGDRPYRGPETQMRDIMYNNPYKAPPSPPVSEESKDLITQMLKFEPGQRVTIDGIRRHAVFKSRSNGMDLLSQSYFPNKSSTTEDLGLSADLKHSISVGLTKDYVNRIFRKLDNYRACCGFFLNFAVSIKPYLTKDKDYILDDLHIFTYYLLKFGHNKFSFLCEHLESKECPKKLLKHVETEYWNDFLESDKYPKLKQDTEKGREIIEKLFKQFRIVELGPYLNRAGRNHHELDSIYNDNVHVDCTAGFTGKLLEAIYVLQKMSQTKKDALAYELSKILMDLEFGKLLEDYMDNYEIEIDVQGYKIEKDKQNNNNINMKKFLRQRTW